MFEKEGQDENVFVTKDLGLSAYLKSKGIDLIRIEKGGDQSPYTQKPVFLQNFMQFVFRIKADDPFVLNLQDEWENSRHCGEIKRVMYFHKIIKQDMFKYRDDLQNNSLEYNPDGN